MERPAAAHGGWLLLEYDGLDAQIEIPSISCVLKSSEIYERIEFQNDVSETERAERDERLRDM